MAQRDTRTRVGYDVDRASVNQVVISNEAIRKSVEGVTNVLGEMNPATASGINMLMTRFDLLGRNLNDDVRIAKDFREELERLDGTVVEPEIKVKQTGGNGQRNRNGVNTLDRLSTVGSQVFSGLGQSELANAAGLLGDVTGAFTTLNPILLGTIAVSGAAALALGTLNTQLDVYRQGIEAGFAAQDRYIDSLKNLTTEQAQQALEVERRNNRFLTAETNNVQAQIWEAWDNAVAEHGDAGARALWAVANPTAQLDERLKALRGSLEESDGYLSRLRFGIENNAFAPNDAAEAEARLAAERERTAQITISAAVRADQLTTEQRQQRIDAIDDEIWLLQAFGSESAETQIQITNLIAEAQGLEMVFHSTADSAAELAARIEAIDLQTDNYFDSLTDEVKAQEKLFEARTEYTQAVTEGAAKEKELLDETQDKREEIADETADRIADIEERSAKERYKILRDFNRTWTNAVGERDALAGKQAKIAAADRLEDQAENDVDALIKQKKATDKQLAALDRSYGQQYARLVQSLNAELSIKQTAMNRSQVDVINAQNAQAMIAMYGAGQQRQIHENMWGGINQTAVQWASNTVNTLRGIMGAYTGGYATQYPMSVGSQPVTLNYNVTGTQNTMTTSTFRNLIQAAAARGGAGSAYQ